MRGDAMRAKNLLMFSSIVLVVLSMSGCMTTAVDNTQRESEISRIASDRNTQLNLDLVVVELRKKFRSQGSAPTLEQLTGRNIPTASDLTAIAVYYSITSDYQQKYIEIIRRYNYQYVDIFELNKAAFTTLAIDLYSQKITFGEYNRRVEEGERLMNEAIRQRDAELASSRTVQATNNSAAYSNYRQYLQNQRLINSLNQPARFVPFTCERNSNRVTCR